MSLQPNQPSQERFPGTHLLQSCVSASCCQPNCVLLQERQALAVLPQEG